MDGGGEGRKEGTLPGNFCRCAGMFTSASRSIRSWHWVDFPARSRPSIATSAPRFFLDVEDDMIWLVGGILFLATTWVLVL